MVVHPRHKGSCRSVDLDQGILVCKLLATAGLVVRESELEVAKRSWVLDLGLDLNFRNSSIMPPCVASVRVDKMYLEIG